MQSSFFGSFDLSESSIRPWSDWIALQLAAAFGLAWVLFIINAVEAVIYPKVSCPVCLIQEA